MTQHIKYLGNTLTFELATPEETWSLLTNLGSKVREELVKENITEFSLGKVYLRLDMRFQHFQEPSTTSKLAQCYIEGVNVTYKHTEDSKPINKKFKMPNIQTFEDLKHVYAEAKTFAEDIDRSLKLYS